MTITSVKPPPPPHSLLASGAGRLPGLGGAPALGLGRCRPIGRRPAHRRRRAAVGRLGGLQLLLRLLGLDQLGLQLAHMLAQLGRLLLGLRLGVALLLQVSMRPASSVLCNDLGVWLLSALCAAGPALRCCSAAWAKTPHCRPLRSWRGARPLSSNDDAGICSKCRS